MKGMPDKHINKQPIFVLMKTVAVELEQFDFLEFQLNEMVEEVSIFWV